MKVNKIYKMSNNIILTTLFFFMPQTLLAVPIIGHSYPLFAVDSGAEKVFRIDSDKTVTEIATGLALPRSITYGSDRSLFVGQEDGKIYKIQPSTGNKELFASVSGFVRGLAFDTGGNLYVAATTGEITKIDASGEESTFVSGIGYAQGLAFDSSGDLYVATGGMGDNKIKKVKPDGTIYDFAITELNPVPLSFDLQGFPDGYLLSAEHNPAKPELPALIQIDSSGNINQRITFPGTSGPMNGIAVTQDGYIYLNRLTYIQKLDSNFNEVDRIEGFSSLFSITSVPEPATLLLLGVGSLLLRKRKH